MAKYENIRALAKKQLQAVTESSDRWKAFLRTAAIAYNYSFPNQIFSRKSPSSHLTSPMSSHFPEQHRKARAFLPICWRICSVIWWLPTIQTCIISWFFETGKSSAKPTSRLIAAESGMSPIPCAKASQEWLSDFL